MNLISVLLSSMLHLLNKGSAGIKSHHPYQHLTCASRFHEMSPAVSNYVSWSAFPYTWRDPQMVFVTSNFRGFIQHIWYRDFVWDWKLDDGFVSTMWRGHLTSETKYTADLPICTHHPWTYSLTKTHLCNQVQWSTPLVTERVTWNDSQRNTYQTLMSTLFLLIE